MASLAMAEEVTRDSYTAAVEPICKTNTRADEKLFESGAAALKANSKVLSFGFRYCKLEPLKFT
jgi:hypothetical protein